VAKPKRRNPKISSKEPEPSKPPPPSELDVPEGELDHSAGADDAYPLTKEDEPKVEEEVEEEAGGVGAPPTDEPAPAGVGEPVAKPPEPQDIQKPEEGDPGKSKKEKHVRGVAPGDRITY
jgi:hypothetical protein